MLVLKHAAHGAVKAWETTLTPKSGGRRHRGRHGSPRRVAADGSMSSQQQQQQRERERREILNDS